MPNIWVLHVQFYYNEFTNIILFLLSDSFWNIWQLHMFTETMTKQMTEFINFNFKIKITFSDKNSNRSSTNIKVLILSFKLIQ
jgi:hypothetical protein